jgi:hypothetical protein
MYSNFTGILESGSVGCTGGYWPPKSTESNDGVGMGRPIANDATTHPELPLPFPRVVCYIRASLPNDQAKSARAVEE